MATSVPATVAFAAMPTRRQKRFARFFAVFTALVTTWCLGCSAFGPLIDALAGGAKGGGMVCGSEGPPVASSGDGHSAVQEAPNGTTAAPGDDCSCLGCYAATPVLQLMTVRLVSPPAVAARDLDAFLSVDRSPLVPPPQAQA
jgi:hypothetical protein